MSMFFFEDLAVPLNQFVETRTTSGERTLSSNLIPKFAKFEEMCIRDRCLAQNENKNNQRSEPGVEKILRKQASKQASLTSPSRSAAP